MCGPSERISALEVDEAIGKMKQGKSGGPTGVVSEMLKAAGETGTMWMTDVCNAVVRDGKIPEDWSRSWMVNVFEGKGDALTCGSYRGIKLLEHAMKVLERVIEGRVKKIVKIDDMHFGFMAGRSTTNAFFIVRQLQEKYLARNKELWMAFVDLKKAFDRVPREVVWWALRYLGVDEWIVSVIRAMYEDATTKVKLNGRESKLLFFLKDLFLVRYCSLSCWRRCLESSGKVCLWNCFMQMISFFYGRVGGIVIGKVEEVEEWDGSKGSQSECW